MSDTSQTGQAGAQSSVQVPITDLPQRPTKSGAFKMFANVTWLLFGGGLVVLILWLVFGITGTILLAFPDGLGLLKLSPVLLSPTTKYPDLTVSYTQLGTVRKLQRFVWILLFGLPLSIIHLMLALLYLPLRFLGVPWAGYHARAMVAAFNPAVRIVIDQEAYPNAFDYYNTAQEVATYSGAQLKGKVAIVTGCNTGIGKETARVLYGEGATVVMACRNLEKAEAAKKDILDQMGADNAANLQIIRLDLGDLKTIDEFVTAFHALENIDTIDYVVCNAGVMAFPEHGLTEDGCEAQFGINHMGHFYLTNKLLPTLKQSRSRVIALSSCANYFVPSVTNLTLWLKEDAAKNKGPTPEVVPYDIAGYRYYYISKLCNVLFARQLNRLYNADGIVALAVHPGGVNTELGRHTVPDMDMMKNSDIRLIGELTKQVDPDRGAACSMFAICATDEMVFGGETRDVNAMNVFIDDTRFREDKMHFDFQNNKNAEIDAQLWKYSCDIIRSLDYLSLQE